ncbi:MAG: hypothetical protein R2797_02500 [Gelidibacter sp.]
MMKSLRNISIVVVMASLFSNCSSAQKLQEKAPFDLEEVYCQKWIAGVKGGGSGINLFLDIKNQIPQNIQLDSAYFRGRVAKIELIEDKNTIYVARFDSDFNQKTDIVMSSDPNEEYGNQAPKINGKFPFELKDSECVISFKEQNETKYFKIENIVERHLQNYPSAPTHQE